MNTDHLLRGSSLKRRSDSFGADSLALSCEMNYTQSFFLGELLKDDFQTDIQALVLFVTARGRTENVNCTEIPVQFEEIFARNNADSLTFHRLRGKG